MSFTAQELNTRVTLSRFEETVVLGNVIEEWVEYAHAFAKVEPLVGREYMAAAANWPHVPLKVTMRYRPGVLTTDRLTIRGEAFGIKSVQEIKFRRRELLIYAEREPNQ